MKISSPWIPHYQSPKMLYTSLKEFAIERPLFLGFSIFFSNFLKELHRTHLETRSKSQILVEGGLSMVNSPDFSAFINHKNSKQISSMRTSGGGSIIFCLKFKRILIKLIQKYVPWGVRNCEETSKYT